MNILVNSDNLTVNAVANADDEDGIIMITFENGAIGIENYAIDVKVEFDCSIPLCLKLDPDAYAELSPDSYDVLEKTLTLMQLDSVVPKFISGERYIIHLTKKEDEGILHIAFASKSFERQTETNYVWQQDMDDTMMTFYPYLGGWLEPREDGTEDIDAFSVLYYVSEAMFEAMGMEKNYLPTESKFANGDWLKSQENGSSSGGGSGSGDDLDDHEFVDLGLSVNWATMNVGASSVEDYGDLFAWGETETKEPDEFTWEHYRLLIDGGSTSYDISKYTVADGRYNSAWYSNKNFIGDGRRTLLPVDDAATVNWSSKWRTPSQAEWQELIQECTWTWAEDLNGSGVNGWIIRSNVQGYTDKWIFLPASGYSTGEGLETQGTGFWYWTRNLTLNTFNAEEFGGDYTDENDYNMEVTNSERSNGDAIRPVCEKN